MNDFEVIFHLFSTLIITPFGLLSSSLILDIIFLGNRVRIPIIHSSFFSSREKGEKII